MLFLSGSGYGEKGVDGVNIYPYRNLPGNEGVFVVGEELIYNVRYGFINLGRIHVSVVDKESSSNGPVFVARAEIDSYSGVPFVSLSHVYSSKITQQFYSVWFESLEKKKDTWDILRYEFDYDDSRVIFVEGVKGNSESVTGTDTLYIDSYFQDGLSLFYFARGYVHIDEPRTIATMINKDVVTTDFDFNPHRKSIKSKAVPYNVDVIELQGKANFRGIFGLTGAFRGWFTNDVAAIPIEAKLRVLIGNVTVELVEWKRTGWNPPEYIQTNN